METLDVESVAEIDPPAGVDAPRYVLYGGKGGVGKTTMAAATGLASAEDGTPTLVISTDPAHSLSDTFEHEIGPEPTRIDEERPLHAIEIDPDATMDEPGVLGGLANGDSPVAELMGGAAMPGADEAVAMQQLLRYMEDDRFERVIVDTAPTGHTLRLLELPELLDGFMGRLLELRDRLGGLVEGMGSLFGGDDAEPDAPGLDEMRDRIERLRTALRDPMVTDFRLVTIPETMSVDESGRLLERLEAAGIPVETIIVNRILEDPAAASGEDADWIVAPDPEGCAFCAHRWDVQRAALADAVSFFRGREVKRVPLFSQDVRGRPMLRVVASCLD